MAHLPMLERQVHIDGFLQVSDNEAIAAARRLAREEGIFAGFSSGANLAAALQLLHGPCRGGTIAILICDSGLKYLSTGLLQIRPSVAWRIYGLRLFHVPGLVEQPNSGWRGASRSPSRGRLRRWSSADRAPNPSHGPVAVVA